MFRSALILTSVLIGYLPFSQLLRAYLLFTDMSVYLLAVHAGAVPLYFALHATRRRVALFLAAVAVLCLVQAAFSSEPIDGPRSALKVLVLSAGFVAVFQLALAAWRKPAPQRAWAREALWAFLVVHLVVLISRLVLGLLSNALPITYDRYLYAFDAAFGLQLSFAAGRLFRRFTWFAEFCHLVYVGLPFALLLLFSRLQESRRRRWLLLANFALIGIVGRFCYSAVPAMGPIYQFPDVFPLSPPDVSVLTIELVRLPAGARNAMPSLHIVWAFMLLAWTKGKSTSLRLSLGLFLLFTLLATLGLGEHYVVDLVVAVPFSLLIAPAFSALGREGPWRLAPTAAGTVLVVAWFLLIRGAAAVLLSQPWSIVLLSIATVAIPLHFYRPWLTGSPSP